MREHIDGFPVYRASGKDYDHIKISEGYHIPLHDYIIEKKIGREIKKEEVVHHIDLDIRNNSIDNLYLCSTRSKHGQIHSCIGKFIIKPLLEKNIIYFNRKEGNYKIK